MAVYDELSGKYSIKLRLRQGLWHTDHVGLFLGWSRLLPRNDDSSIKCYELV